MNVNPLKIKKTAKILKIIMNLGFWSTLIFSIFFIGLFAMLAINSDLLLKFIKNFNFSLSPDLNGITQYQVIPNENQLSKVKEIFILYIPMITLYSTMIIIVIHQINGLLKSVINDKPFEAKNSSRLTIIGIVLLISSVILNISKSFVAMTIINNFSLKKLHVNFTINITMLLVGFLILIIAGVFRYGNFLQNEYDATI